MGMIPSFDQPSPKWLHLVQSTSIAPLPTRLLDPKARSSFDTECTLGLARILPHIPHVSHSNQQDDQHHIHTF